LDADAVWEACQLDKKVRGRAVNFMLLAGLGSTARVDDVTGAEVAEALASIQPA
jgi:3-dehydroquinate synthetase